jgi:hypothetical protein
MEVQRLIMPEPATSSLPAVVALLRAHARIEEQFGNALGSIHGLALKELLLLMHLAARRRSG